MKRHIHTPLRILFALGLALGLQGGARAAVLYLEGFTDTDGGWGTRDGEMVVSNDGGNDWLVGSFASQGFFPVPETDAFLIDSGANFRGGYSTAAPNPLTQIQFRLMANDVLPSDLFIRLVNGSDVFSYQFNLGSMSVGSWSTFTVNLLWNYGWSGPSESAFNSALGAGGVDQVEIQLTRSGTGAQFYFLDDVQTLDTDLGGGGGGGGSAVPEPNQALMMLLGAALVYTLRRAVPSWSSSVVRT